MEMQKVRDPDGLAIRVFFLLHTKLAGIVSQFENVTPRSRQLPTMYRDDLEIPCLSKNALERVVRVGRAGQLPPIAVRGF